jgi:hypothetical protein
MIWQVDFSGLDGVGKFDDASKLSVEMDRSLIETVGKMVMKGKGKALSKGIKAVREKDYNLRSEGQHFILSVKNADKRYSMLFKLGETEKSRLMGVSPHATREELLNILYSVLAEKADEVNLLI